ncbi:MAG: hypothetical protein A2W91_11465 [Bacteroidetes bacterium GWF2_38_335]|nr:MAG: hypothetical protein A2W91_11465 [Bacteroidetes bacterium GWF2_38_335]OFY81686.1 MAG: hypothetical protein A2281_05580 [Bacteroidetes bacterium RIFOXYA12_FULL_38_20]HBS87750.1 methylglyoxal synthase [Bacteroidales bacterium]
MKNIAVIAHDKKKAELAEFLKEREKWIEGVNLLATGKTAEFLETHGIKVKHMSMGRSGGYVEITEMIKNKEVDIVIFLVDPEVKQTYHKDIEGLIHVCNMQNIPWASNYASAELLIIGLIRKEQADEARANYLRT